MTTRRAFMLRTAGALAGLSSAMLFPNNLPTSAAVEQPLPSVAVAKGSNTDTAADILRTALDGLGGIERFVKPGQVVVIKPNATWAYPPFTASSTDPDLLVALIHLVASAGARHIIIMDHCSIDPGAAEALRVSGIGKALDKLDVEKQFFDRYRIPKKNRIEIDLPRGKAFPKVEVIKSAVDADVRINLAVAKCHMVTRFTMAMKHMMGFLSQPGNLHTRLEQGIADLNSSSEISAHLSILEAIRVRLPQGSNRVSGGFDTDTTNPRAVKRFNQVVAGIDPVLIDAYGCLNYFSTKPEELTHVKLGAELGAGEMDVEKATAGGRLRTFTVGAALPTPLPKATSAATPVPSATLPIEINTQATPSAALVQPTLTPQPTEGMPNAGLVGEPQHVLSDGTPAASTIRPSMPEPGVRIDPWIRPPIFMGSLILAALGAIIYRQLKMGDESKTPDR